MTFPRGSTLPGHLVTCLGCHDPILRKTYWRQPYCAACRKSRAAAAENKSLKVLREQARRYRILMHLLGYEDFGELLKEVRGSPMAFRRRPESRGARYDMTLERRQKGARASSGG